ncbi:hypothetical protein ACFL42_01340 [Candidatus Omnitrophota bacterium]
MKEIIKTVIVAVCIIAAAFVLRDISIRWIEHGKYKIEAKEKSEAKAPERYKEMARTKIEIAKSEGKIIAGMTASDVEDILGSPDYRDRTLTGKTEKWHYYKSPKYVIQFADGKVQSYWQNY